MSASWPKRGQVLGKVDVTKLFRPVWQQSDPTQTKTPWLPFITSMATYSSCE
jgi:hypothetical protein